MKKLLFTVFAILAASTIIYGETTVTVLYKGGQEWTKFMNEIIKRYEAAHPDIKIKLYPINTDSDDIYETKTAMVLKNDSSVDLAFVDCISVLHKYINANLLEPYDEMQKWEDWTQFYTYLKEGARKDGRYYTVPICSGNIMLYYNKNIFKKAGIPVPWQPGSWEDILETALTIKEKCPGVYPFWCHVLGNAEATTMFTGLMLLNGTKDKLYRDGKWIVTSNGLLDTLKFFSDLRKEKLFPPDPVIFDSMSGSKVLKEYAPAQKIAIFMEGGWLKKLIWTGELAKARDYYDIALFPMQFGQDPKYISMAGGWSVAMSAKSQNKKAAWDLLKYIGSREGLYLCSEYSTNTTCRKDVAEMKEYPELLRRPTQLLEYGVERPIDEDYPAISRELSLAIESTAQGKETPEEAMKAYADNVERLVGKDKIVRESYKAE